VATNISRLDFQTTIKLNREVPRFAETIERDALRFVKERDSRLQVELKRNSKTGNTVYLGSRKSARFMRVYNKEAQSHLDVYKNCWRGEVEMHDELAMRRARGLLAVQCKAQFIASVVSQDFCNAGVFWPSLPESFGNISRLVPQVPRSQLLQADTARVLTWLSQQVRPSISRLLATVDPAVIKEALGLDD
jgi:hypothetical protein